MSRSVPPSSIHDVRTEDVMTRSQWASGLAIAFTLGATGSVVAQSLDVRCRVFVEGALLADNDATLAEGSNPSTGTTKGVGVRVGFGLNDRYSLRFEADTPGWHV